MKMKLPDFLHRHHTGGRATCPPDYVDLGLPSGTLWADRDSDPDDRSVRRERLPSAKEFEELCEYCQWTWQDRNAGYLVTGPNGNSILIRSAGAGQQAGEAFSGLYRLRGRPRTALVIAAQSIRTIRCSGRPAKRTITKKT